MTLSVAVGKSDHAQGPENAPATLVEYGDYQCPYCADVHPMNRTIAEKMGAKLRFVFRHMPRLASAPLQSQRGSRGILRQAPSP